MSENFVTKRHKQLYKGFVEGIREDLGRAVTLHIPGAYKACPNCLLDPANKKSTGIYSPRANFPSTTTWEGTVITAPVPFTGGICPVCNGTGQVQVETTKVIQCGVRALKTDQKRYIIQGIEAENDFRLKADIKYYDDFRKARIIEIDGVPCESSTDPIKAGLGDLIQIKVFCKRSNWNAGRKLGVSNY